MKRGIVQTPNWKKTMETLRHLISEMALCAIEESVNEEPYEGNLQVRFREGYASPYTEFSKTQSLLN